MWPADLVVATSALHVSIEFMIRAGLLEPEKRDSAVAVVDPTFIAVG